MFGSKPKQQNKLAIPAAFANAGIKPKQPPAATPAKKTFGNPVATSMAASSTAKPAAAKPAATSKPSAFKSTAAAAATPKPAPKTNNNNKKYCCGLGLFPLLALCCCLLLVIIIIIVLALTLGADNSEIRNLYFAQSHVIPPEGLSWYNGATKLRLTSKREALFMFELGSFQPEEGKPMYVFGYDITNKYLGSVKVSPPEDLPPTEANQTDKPFSTVHYSATLPASWISPNFSLAVSTLSAPNPALCCTTNTTMFTEVDADSELNMYTLPFYLYGANEANSVPMSTAGAVPPGHQREFWAKHPFAKINFIPHPIGKMQLSWAITPPRNGGPAYVLTDRANETDGFMTMGIVLQLLSIVRGHNALHGSQFYSPMMTLRNGMSSGAGGGLGGGNRATGDAAYTGVFIHEVGHGFGLPHAGGAYPGSYPYESGSLSFSKWGYDSGRKVFLPNSLPYPSATCKKSRVLTERGECAKQDYMQGGAGDQAKGDNYTMNSDYNAAKIQRWGSTSLYYDSTFPTGFSKWDAALGKRVQVDPITTGRGQGGLDNGLPHKTNVLVYTMIVAYSYATPAARRFYPIPPAYRGNLLRYVDPTNATQLLEISGKGPAPWYCVNSGCDYTFKITYRDGTVLHQLHQGAFRAFYSDNFNSGMNDPLSGGSFVTFGMNFPGDKPALKIDMLYTPKPVVNGMTGATVLMTYNF